MGGDEKVAKHRSLGKLPVRERIALLLDDGTFHEIGSLTGRATYDDDGNLVDLTPANFVMGRGRIDGRTVVVGGDDFTRAALEEQGVADHDRGGRQRAHTGRCE